jgi:hypothetical protein
VTNKKPEPRVTSENLQEGMRQLKVVPGERPVPGKNENGAGGAWIATVAIFGDIAEDIVEGIEVASVVAGEIQLGCQCAVHVIRTPPAACIETMYGIAKRGQTGGRARHFVVAAVAMDTGVLQQLPVEPLPLLRKIRRSCIKHQGPNHNTYRVRMEI